jgi:hypothetical protein
MPYALCLPLPVVNDSNAITDGIKRSDWPIFFESEREWKIHWVRILQERVPI